MQQNIQQPTQQFEKSVQDIETKEKIEVDVDQVLFEIVKDMNLDIYSLYRIRNMFYRILSLSENDRKELYKELELLMEVSK